MKVVFFIIFAFTSYVSFAQKPADNFMPGEMKYAAEDSIVNDLNSNVIRLYGKADFKYGRVHFVAEEIFINRKTQKVIATGLVAFSVPEVKGNVNSNHKILTYTMGENAVFIQ